MQRLYLKSKYQVKPFDIPAVVRINLLHYLMQTNFEDTFSKAKAFETLLEDRLLRKVFPKEILRSNSYGHMFIKTLAFVLAYFSRWIFKLYLSINLYKDQMNLYNQQAL